MTRLNPVSRQKFISKMHRLGFEGPFSGGKHFFMSKGDLNLTIPNPHQTDIGINLLQRILKQAGVARDEWLKA